MIRAAYVPGSAWVVLATGLALGVVCVLAFALSRTRARWGAWALVVATGTGLHIGLHDAPAGFRMLALIAGTLLAMKAVVCVESRIAGASPLTRGAWISFALGWFGMQPRLFIGYEPAAPGPARSDWMEYVRGGVKCVFAGSFLIAAASIVWRETGSRLAATLLVLPGISLALHFGVFPWQVAFWRRRGVDAYPLFRAPLRSRTLKEFWGRRWNLAFSEMTALGVYRPLVPRVGRRVATFASFLFSGLLHELAISVPVGAGYGLPLGYFALHGLALSIEPWLVGRGWLGGGRGRLWTLLIVVAPAPILFHPPFLRGIVWPLLEIAG